MEQQSVNVKSQSYFKKKKNNEKSFPTVGICYKDVVSEISENRKKNLIFQWNHPSVL